MHPALIVGLTEGGLDAALHPQAKLLCRTAECRRLSEKHAFAGHAGRGIGCLGRL